MSYHQSAAFVAAFAADRDISEEKARAFLEHYATREESACAAVNAYYDDHSKEYLEFAVQTLGSLLALENSGSRLPKMLELTEEWGLSGPLFWRMFRDWWPVCDWTWSYRDEILEALREKRARPYLSKRHKFPLTVYRGCLPDHVHGLS